jgi:hypothetical protein
MVENEKIVESKNEVVTKGAETQEAVSEYTFESGVKEIMKRVEALLMQKDYVVIAVFGEHNAGKTKFSGQICSEFKVNNRPVVYATTFNSFWIHDKRVLAIVQKNLNSKKGILVFGATNPCCTNNEEYRHLFRNYQDKEVQEVGKKYNLKIDKVDIIVAIYSPKRPFGATPVADIIIRNEYAIDKQ